MKRIVCGALALLLFLCACGKETSVPELLEPVSVVSDLAAVQLGDVYKGEVLEAHILPDTEELSFSTAGRIGEICVVIGDAVKKGDPLVRLDVPSLQARRDDLADRLDYAKTIDGFDTRAAQLNLELIAQESGEYSVRYRLYKNEQDKAALERARQIADLEEQLEEAEEALNVDSVLTAPFSGTVAYINGNVGDAVWPNAVVAVVASDSRIKLYSDYINSSAVEKADSIYAMVEGERYEVTYIPMDGEEYVTKALSGATMHSTFSIKGGNTGLVGQYALLYLMTSHREQVLNIPANALLRDRTGHYVYVNENGEKVRRDVETGLITDAQAEIRSGLEEGEEVYVLG